MKRASSKEDKEGHDSIFDLGPKYEELVQCSRGVGAEIERKLLERFKYWNGNLLREFKGRWDLPLYLTGLGIGPIPTDESVLKRCTILKRDFYGGSAGLEPPTRLSDVEWRLHSLVRGRWREEGPLVGERSVGWYDGSETYGKAYVATCYELWQEMGLGDLFGRKASPHSYKRVLRYMEKLWNAAGDQLNYLKSYVKPDKNVEREPKYTLLPIIAQN